MRRELLKVGHELAEPLADHRLVSVHCFQLERVVDRHLRTARAEDRDALVVRDPKQPGLQPDRADLSLEPAQRGGHGVLKRVRGVVRIPEERAAVAVQRLVVTLVDDRERAPVARCGEPSQPVVAKRPEPGREDFSLR